MKKIAALYIIISLLFSGMISTIGVSSPSNVGTNNGADYNVEADDYDQKYAVIVVGRYAGTIWDLIYWNLPKYYKWYLSAAQNLYQTLTEKYDFTDENIYVLITQIPGFEEPDIFNPYIIDFSSTKDNIQMVLNKFKKDGEKEMSANDLLFFTFINHGNIDTFGLPVPDKTITSTELANYVDEIDGELIFVLQPCHSGSFIDELSADERIICTSLSLGEIWGNSWIESFIQGLNGDADMNAMIGNYEIGDGNNDSKVSMEEAYYFAAEYLWEISSNHQNHSLLDDNGDGNGSWYNDPANYDKNDPEKDGSNAKDVFLDDSEPVLLEAYAYGPYKGKAGEEIKFYGGVSGNTLDYTWYWDFGDGEHSDEQNPKHAYNDLEKYTATLIVKDENGDTAESTAEATVTKKKSSSKSQLNLLERIMTNFPLLEKILHLINFLTNF